VNIAWARGRCRDHHLEEWTISESTRWYPYWCVREDRNEAAAEGEAVVQVDDAQQVDSTSTCQAAFTFSA
jgi:hypothetical protein